MTDTVLMMDEATANFYLRNTISAGAANEQFTLGNANDTPLAGRWQINATHAGVGVYRATNGVLYLKNALATGFADNAMVMGIPGDQGMAGDWTGKGYDSPGIFRSSNSGFYLSNQVTNGPVFADITFTYGSASDVPITGNWIAQTHDGIGMFRPTNGFVYLRNTLTTGFADNAFFYGTAGDQPVAGHWEVVYPPAPPAPVLIAKTAAPQSGSISVPGDTRIGG